MRICLIEDLLFLSTAGLRDEYIEDRNGQNSSQTNPHPARVPLSTLCHDMHTELLQYGRGISFPSSAVGVPLVRPYPILCRFQCCSFVIITITFTNSKSWCCCKEATSTDGDRDSGTFGHASPFYRYCLVAQVQLVRC